MKKIIMLMSVLALLSTGSAFATENDIMLISEAPENNYSDVSNEHWAYSQIEKWSDLDVIQGNNGTFRPNDYITRGEVAVILDRIMNYQVTTDNTFSDLEEKFYTDAIIKANEAGIILGYGDTVKAEQYITRQEAIVMIARALGIEESEKETSFDDKDEIATWAVGLVNAMAQEGYIQGYNNKFNPLNTITRAELVTIIDNAITRLYSEAGTHKDENYENTVIVNTPDVVLENTEIGGNLIVAEGVAEGDLTLNSVSVDGRLIIRGGGIHSIYINKSKINRIEVEKNPQNPVRLYVASDSEVEEVVVEETDVSLDGEIEKVVLAEKASVNVLGEVKSLEVAGEASEASITVSEEATINNLEVNTNVTITNEGTINSASLNADSIVVSGNTPTDVTISDEVTVAPVDGEGSEITETSQSNSGSSSSSSSSSTVRVAAITVTESNGVYSFTRTSTNSVATNVRLTVTFGSETYTGTLSTKANAVTLINNILANMDNNTIIATLEKYKNNDTITGIAFDIMLSGSDYQAIVDGSKDVKEAASEALDTLTLDQIITLANAVCN